MKTDFAVPEDKVLLGIIIKAHGVRGNIVVHCFSSEPDNLKHYKTFSLIDKEGRISQSLTVRLCRRLGTSALIGFQGIETKEQTVELLGAGVLVNKKELPELSSDEFYWYQYEGKKIVDTSGNLLGTVKGLFDNGAQIVLTLQGNKGEEIFIPAVGEIIVRVENEKLVVAPPPGLLTVNTK